MTTDGVSRSPEPQELLRVAIEYFLRDVNVALPGKIDSYDPAEQKADVKPLVKRLLSTQDGGELVEELPIIPGVPVIFPRGGEFFISMPVKKDDYCLLVFCSFPVDQYKAGKGKDAPPQDFGMHDLSDAVALMGFAPFAKAIKDADADNLVLGQEEGVQMHIATDKIELGEKDAAEWVSIDSKVQTELNRLKDDLQTLNDTYGAHTHVVQNAICTVTGGSGAPAVGVNAPGTADAPSDAPGTQDIEETKSALVTIKE